MQSTLRENYRNRSLSAPGGTASSEARIILESAVQHSVVTVSPNLRSQRQESVVVNGQSTSNNSNVYTELGQELVAVSDQVDERIKEIIRQIITRISAAVSDQDLDGISVPFFEAIESIVKRRINIDTFINVMVFCITLVRRYRATAPSSWQDKAMWMTEQIYELMASAYQRYHIDDWIEEQGGWTGVLRLVREKYQTITDYAIGRRGSMRQNLTAGVAVTIVGVVAFTVWYNW